MATTYGLEKVTSPKYPIYQQVSVFYEYCEQVLAFTERTMALKTHSINDFIKFSGIQKLEDITNQQVYDWVKWHKGRGNTARSINNYLHQLRAMLKWQKDENIEMPKLKISRISFQKEAPARKNWFTRQQIKLALLYAGPREWLLIALSFDCGLRIEELMALRLCDISRRKVQIIGKGNKLRWGMMSRKTKRRLKNWVKHERITDYLWRGRNGIGHLSQEKARREMQAVFSRAGFSNFRPHDLRHSFATELKLLGLSTRKIQLALGHTSEAITERYLSDLDGVTIESVRKEVSFALFRLRVRAFFANLFYLLPRITLKPAN